VKRSQARCANDLAMLAMLAVLVKSRYGLDLICENMIRFLYTKSWSDSASMMEQSAEPVAS
jgi:hypothetical protein